MSWKIDPVMAVTICPDTALSDPLKIEVKFTSRDPIKSGEEEHQDDVDLLHEREDRWAAVKVRSDGEEQAHDKEKPHRPKPSEHFQTPPLRCLHRWNKGQVGASRICRRAPRS